MPKKNQCTLYIALAGLLILLLLSSETFSEDPPTSYLDPVIFSGFADKNSPPPTKKSTLEKDLEEIPLYWQKSFPRNEVAFLRMSWTGDKILYLLKKNSDSLNFKKHTITVVNTAGEALKTWEVASAVKNLNFDGEAKSLLVILENGSSLYYPDIERHVQYKVIVGAGNDSLIYPRGKNILVVHDHPHMGQIPKDDPENTELFVLSPQGEPLWTYSEISDSEKAIETGRRWMFGFLQKKRENYLLKVSNTGEISMNNREKLLWKKRVPGTPLSVAVPFFEGKRYAVSTSGPEGKIYFLNDRGRGLWTVEFFGGAVSMAWSTVGNLLAAYGNTDEGQKIRAYTALGTELWKKTLPDRASRTSKIFVSALGKVVSAGVEESSGRWFIRGWDNTGKDIWNIRVEGELIDFFTAWNGRSIVVLSRAEKGDLLTLYNAYGKTI